MVTSSKYIEKHKTSFLLEMLRKRNNIDTPTFTHTHTLTHTHTHTHTHSHTHTHTHVVSIVD